MHTTVSLLYAWRKIRENIFYQGKIRELSGNFIFKFLWPPWRTDQTGVLWWFWLQLWVSLNVPSPWKAEGEVSLKYCWYNLAWHWECGYEGIICIPSQAISILPVQSCSPSQIVCLLCLFDHYTCTSIIATQLWNPTTSVTLCTNWVNHVFGG